MEVSTKLFNAQAIKNFGKINEQIQDTQARIASGKSFLKRILLQQLITLIFGITIDDHARVCAKLSCTKTYRLS